MESTESLWDLVLLIKVRLPLSTLLQKISVGCCSSKSLHKQILFSMSAIFPARHHLSTQSSHSWTTRTHIGRRKKWKAKSCGDLKLVHSAARSRDVAWVSLVNPWVSTVLLFPAAILANRKPYCTPVCWGCWKPVVWTICHSCKFKRESLWWHSLALWANEPWAMYLDMLQFFSERKSKSKRKCNTLLNAEVTK